jgi:amino acid adenylation domain-containing protein
MDKQVTGYRLAPQQTRIWRAHDSNGNFRTWAEVQVNGKLRKDVLREVVEKSMARHEILRTTFESAAGKWAALQVVADEGQLCWREDSLKDIAAAEREQKLRELFRQETVKEREAENGLSVNVVEMDEDEHVLRLSLSSMRGDSRSLKNLVIEIGRFYLAALRGDHMEDEPVQYVQFSEWQNDLLEDEEAQEEKQFWLEQSANESPLQTLPFEAKPTGAQAFVLETHTALLAQELWERVAAMAAKSGVDAETLLLACWQTLLCRLTGHSEALVGKVFDGRKFDAVQDALGLFARCLPLRFRFGKELRFSDILKPLQQSVREASKRQEYFKPEYLAATEGQHTATRILPFAFEYEAWPYERIAGELTFHLNRHYSCIEPCKIKLSCLRTENALIAQFYFDTHLYTRAQVAHLARQFQTLLSAALEHPETPLGELPLRDAEESHELLVEFNDTATDYPSRLCVHELFEQQARAVPEQVAVRHGSRLLSYGELNKRANRLARRLVAEGARPEVIVGICVERSIEMIVGVLAIFKAGAAYLPLDPSYPKERLAYMLDTAAAPLVLTQQSFAGMLPSNTAKLILLDNLNGETGGEGGDGDDDLDVRVEARNLAYVIFTSGSTGQPKGVMIEHQALANYVQWSARAYRVKEGEGTLLHSPLGFDLSVTSLFPPLITGQRINLVPDEKGIEGVADMLRSGTDFSLLKITPAHLDAVRQLLRDETLQAKARVLVIGGEALKEEGLAFWRQHLPEARFVNEYGPTETVVGCCVYEAGTGRVCGRMQDDGAASQEPRASVTGADSAPQNRTLLRGEVPIGFPIANMKIYVADEQLRPAAIGETGGLYVGGAGVARGYLQSPELTAERFIPDPFSTEPGARLYRTGDLARHLGQEGLEFLGRSDHQVKIRGYRIEPAEIEAALDAHTEVRESLVVATQEEEGKRLVAYVVPREPGALLGSVLRHYLREVLPEYMIPSSFIMLDEFPLTPNGKVDSRALPSPEEAQPVWDADFVAPRTQVEEALADIWMEVLRLERVGVHDDFFELGGHSLLVVQVVARLRDTFQVELPPNALFDATTIAQLAEAIIAHEIEPGQTEKIAQILLQVKNMSDEDASVLLNDPGTPQAAKETKETLRD